MMKLILFISFLILVLIISVGFYALIIRDQKSEGVLSSNTLNTNQSQNHTMKIIGWIPYWDQESAKQSFMNNVNSVDYISLFWYRIDPNGNVTTYEVAKEDFSIVDFAHKNNKKAFALIANMADYHENGGWDYKRVDKVIESQSARRKHIQDIVTLVESKNFDGVDIDYEALRKYQRENFSLFMEELSDEMHKRGKLVGVAIHPSTNDNAPDNGPLAQDLGRLSKVVDHLYFMTYLEHGTFSEPGPVGSIGWIEQVMNYSIQEEGVSPEKAYLGIGLMGVSWRIDPGGPTGDDEELTFQEILGLSQRHNTQPIWDDASKTPRLEYTDQFGKHIIWFENNESVKMRIELAQRLGVGGVGLWRIGGEDSQIWQSLRKN